MFSVCVCVCVCVCVFGIFVLKIVVERWFWEFKMLIGSLVELHAWLHSYLCFSLLEKLFSTPPWHLAIYWAFQLPLIAITIASRQLGGSIEISFGPSTASRQLVDRSSFFLAFCWFFPQQILDSFIRRHLFAWHLLTALFVKIYWAPI